MRVAFVSSYLSKENGGISTSVEFLSRALADLGGSVQVFGLDECRWRENDANFWRGANTTMLQTVGPRSLYFAPGLSRKLAAWEPDIVHIHGLWTPTAWGVLQWYKEHHRPYIISPHGMFAPTALAISRRKKWIAGRLYQDALLKGAWGLHCTSAQEVVDAGSASKCKNIFEVQLGVESQGGRIASDRSRRIVYLGRLHPIKNLDQLILAWAKVERDFSQWTLDIAGEGEQSYVARLQQLIRKLDVKRVSLVGPKYHSEKRAFLEDAALFVLPSLSENFGLVVPEALAFELPVICTRFAPWSGLIERECGWWIDPSSNSIEKTLREALKMPPHELSRMGRNGSEWVGAEYSWQRVAQRMLGQYERALRENANTQR